MASIKNSKILWIAWEKQRRSTTLANEIGAELHQLESDLPRPLHYPLLTFKTLQIVFKDRFKYMFAQNPSIVLCFLIMCLKRILRAKVVVDSHTPYISLKGIKKAIFDIMTGMIFNGVDLVIVTNNDLKSIYGKKFPKASFYVLPDMIPEFEEVNLSQLSRKMNILLICTYAEDEPYIEAFKAMRGISNATLYVTGRKRKISKEALALKPDNVFLTDFLSDSEYASILNSVDIVMDLTDIENCMVCGAYEALSVGKPMILSDKKVLVEYFDEGVIHTKNDSKNIARGIELAIENIDKLKKDVRNLRSKRMKEWNEQWGAFLRRVGIIETHEQYDHYIP